MKLPFTDATTAVNLDQYVRHAILYIATFAKWRRYAGRLHTPPVVTPIIPTQSRSVKFTPFSMPTNPRLIPMPTNLRTLVRPVGRQGVTTIQ